MVRVIGFMAIAVGVIIIGKTIVQKLCTHLSRNCHYNSTIKCFKRFIATAVPKDWDPYYEEYLKGKQVGKSRNVFYTLLFAVRDKYRQLFVRIDIEEAKERGFEFCRNIFGDEINHINCRSIWVDHKARAWRVEQLNICITELTIPVVVGQSEQLCDHKFENNGKGAEVCIKCELPFSINC